MGPIGGSSVVSGKGTVWTRRRVHLGVTSRKQYIRCDGLVKSVITTYHRLTSSTLVVLAGELIVVVTA